MKLKVEFRHRTVASVLALALAAGAMITTPSSQAVSVVEVGGNLVQSILNQINTLKVKYATEISQAQAASEYAKTLQRHIQTLENWAQKLSKYEQMITNFGGNFRSDRGIPLDAVEPDFNVAEKCGGAPPGFSLRNITSMLASRLTDATNIPQRQRDICVAIQMLENKKHNDTVMFLTKTLPDIGDVLQQIATIRPRSNTEGSVAESTNNVVQTGVNIDAEFKSYEQQVYLVDQYIAGLRDQQRVLTQTALNGKKSGILGGVVQAAVMRAALDPADIKSDAKN